MSAGKILSDNAFDDIAQALPSIHQRASLYIHNALLMQKIRDMEAEIKNIAPAKVLSPEDQMLKIQALEAEMATLKSTSSSAERSLAERVTELSATVRSLTKSLEESKAQTKEVESQRTTLGEYVAQVEQKLTSAQSDLKNVQNLQNELSQVKVALEQAEAKLSTAVQTRVEVVQPAGSPEDSEIRLAERTRIVAWLRETNAGETVRALYGQKLARLIEQGDYSK